MDEPSIKIRESAKSNEVDLMTFKEVVELGKEEILDIVVSLNNYFKKLQKKPTRCTFLQNFFKKNLYHFYILFDNKLFVVEV